MHIDLHSAHEAIEIVFTATFSFHFSAAVMASLQS